MTTNDINLFIYGMLGGVWLTRIVTWLVRRFQ